MTLQQALLKYAYEECVREREVREAGTPGIRASLFYDACVVALLRSVRRDSEAVYTGLGPEAGPRS